MKKSTSPKHHFISISCTVMVVQLFLIGCSTANRPLRKEVFNYTTYSCLELIEEKKGWVKMRKLAKSPEALKEQRTKTIQDEKTVLGLLKSLTGLRDDKKLERMEVRASAHIRLIDQHMNETNCQE